MPLAALAPTIARVVHEDDPAVPVAHLREMDEVFTESIRRPPAGTAADIGIRIALGANRFSVIPQIMKQGVVLTTIGGIVGLAGVLSLNRLMA